MSVSKAKHFIVLLIIAGTISAIAYLTISKPVTPTKPIQETAWTVNVTSLQYTERAPELNVLGRVESVQKTLITSRVSTTVTKTPVLAGNFFEKGSVILELDRVEVAVLLTQRQADVRELSALVKEEYLRHKSNQEILQTEKKLLELAKKALTRQQRLVKNNVTSQERLDNAEIALQRQQLTVTNRTLIVSNHRNKLDQLAARLDRAKAQLTLAELDMGQTGLKAPFDGWVISLRVASGNRVRSGDPLIELIAAGSMEVRAQIPDRWIPKIKQLMASENRDSKAASTRAYTHIFGERIDFELDRLAAAASTTTGGVDAYFRPVTGNPLILDKSISLHVLLPMISNSFALPVSSVYGYDRIYTVRYTVTAEQRLQPARIERLGRFQDASKAEWLIVTGPDLHPGINVITTQLSNAVSGLKVKIRD